MICLYEILSEGLVPMTSHYMQGRSIVQSLPFCQRSMVVVIINNLNLSGAWVIWGHRNKTFYRGNLLPFHGNTIILCYKAILPW